VPQCCDNNAVRIADAHDFDNIGREPAREFSMHRRSLLQGALATTPLLAGLGGCASTAKSLPTPYAVTVRIDDGVNPDGRGQAAPILVKVFELKSSGNFETADYFALQDRDREALAAELVNADQAIMRSGDERVFKRHRHHRGLSQAGSRALAHRAAAQGAKANKPVQSLAVLAERAGRAGRGAQEWPRGATKSLILCTP
jgi:type VI secretion system VasD/TssJ family lipoprotein